MAKRNLVAAKRPRVAFFTPLLPLQSGLSDYSEELLPHLAESMDIDVVIDDGYQPSTKSIAERFECITRSEFLRRSDAYDTAIYQIANSYDHHAYMIQCMEVCPGILVLHDFCLQYLVMNLLLRNGMVSSLADVLRPDWGSRAKRLARKLQLGQLDPNAFSFFYPLVAHSRAVIVHSKLGHDLVRRVFPDKPLAIIPMGVPLDHRRDSNIRKRFGIAETDFVVASVSTLAYTKRIDIVVRAFADLHANVACSKLLIVGGGVLGEPVRKLIRSLRLEQAVVATGWVSKEDYTSLIGASDVVVDVRFPSGAETSASLSRAIALGRPLVVSKQGTFAEFPDSIAIKIPLMIEGVAPSGSIYEEDDAETDDSDEKPTQLLESDANNADTRKSGMPVDEATYLAKHLRRLFVNGDLRESMSKSALKFAQEELSLARASQRTTEFVQRIIDDQGTVVEPSPIFRGSTSTINAWIYKVCRIGYLIRHYGLRDTLKRVYKEVLKPRRQEHKK